MINQNRLTQTFIDLVKIDSPSGEEEKVSKFMAKKLDALGGNVEFDTYGNIIAQFEGTGEPIMLNCHMDTVEPGRKIKPILKGDKIMSDGTTILGADAKSGVAIIFETLESLREDRKKHLPIDIVFTVEEETGLFGAVNLDYKKLRAKYGVTLDGHSQVENITTAAPGYTRIDVTIFGRGAHAGYEPEKGLSAIKIASEIITGLEVGRIDHETTANVGLIEGGTVRNAVPESVHFKAEIRSRDLLKLEKHTAHFEKVFRDVLVKYPDAKIDLSIFKEFDPYIFEEDHEVIMKIKNALEKLNIKPHLEASGGATDVNVFHQNGVKAVCVGAGFYEAHTTREYALISEMVKAVNFCRALVLK